MDRYERLIEVVSRKTRLSAAQLNEMFRFQGIVSVGISRSPLPNEDDYITYLYMTNEKLREEIDKIDPQLVSEKARRLIEFLRQGRDVSN